VLTQPFGSLYAVAAKGTNALGIPNPTTASVVLTGGNLSVSVTNSIEIQTNGVIANLSSNRLTLNFSSTKGTFSGSVLDTNSSRTILFKGVVLQNLNQANGYFLGTNQSGQVLIRTY